MVVVTIQLWRGGNPKNRKNLGTIHIANDGTGPAGVGNYDVTFFGGNGRVVKRSRVEGFPRKVKGAFDLTLLALRNAFGFRNPTK